VPRPFCSRVMRCIRFFHIIFYSFWKQCRYLW
jgi:hypothetical protein